MKKLVITDGVNYIGQDLSLNDGLDEYIVTQNLNEAKNFKWTWLFAPKKLILNGIRFIFGNDYKYNSVEVK